MRLPVDDEIDNVNAVWLGPPNRTLPFRARYSAYAVGAVVFLLLQMLERYSHAVDLLDADPGSLGTYRVIAEPLRGHYPDEGQWRTALEQAQDTRRLLTTSVLRAMLPKQLQEHVLSEVALMRAVGRVPANAWSSCDQVVAELAQLDGDEALTRHAGYMADFCERHPARAMAGSSFPRARHRRTRVASRS